MKNILVINGSASSGSSNQKLIEYFAELTKEFFSVTVFNALKTLPHFDPELSIAGTPPSILNFRHSVEAADGVLVFTPEYVFSIPSGLKNALEWSVSTTVFSGKPAALITASANGEKGHEELKLIMNTLTAQFTDETTLLIPSIKAKINTQGQITDAKTKEDLVKLTEAFQVLVNERVRNTM